MNIDTIFRLLKNAGFTVLGTDGVYIHLEDPSCILRSFETFTHYAWIAITFITGVLLFGWAIAYIRGSKITSLLTNLRNLVLIFGTLTAAKPIVNMIWGGDVFARGCKTINVSIAEIQRILAAKKMTLARYNPDDLYEEFNIYDSGVDQTIAPYSNSPIYSAGEPQNIPVSVSFDGYDGRVWGGQCTPQKSSSVFANQNFTTGQFANSDPAFEKALNTVFRAEGGYVDDPFDSGGETKYGVSKNNNPDIDVKNITRSDAENIAYQRYYKKYGIDRLPDGIRGDVFQVGWACGPGVAIKQLQSVLGVPKTGIIDDATINASQNYSSDLRGQYLTKHRNYLIGITERNPTQRRFLNGWMNRVELIRDNGCNS
ncbi:MAG: hypothetical protein JW985_02780 [Alphaproteobacteria bacterium]|nr:hypothetical protein [Alphaproteobacteria bacterium]